MLSLTFFLTSSFETAQRTMDVDMALQLSRARRETVSSYENTKAPQAETSLPPIPSLSPHEQREINLARGGVPLPDDGVDQLEGEPVIRSMPSLINLRSHVSSAHDPSLLVSLGGAPSHFLAHDDPSSTLGLPTYQANVSRSEFDFGPMEEFAVQEKERLGISSPTHNNAFNLNALRPRNIVLPESAVIDQPVDGSSDSTPRAIRHRQMSQSNSHPRQHRKGVGGKMALFEGNPSDPPPSFAGNLGLGQGSSRNTGPSLDDLPRPGAPGTGAFGALNTGHDRPYRFSFYSNALSATIHARSLSELPADGQSFEDLFGGVNAPPVAPSKTRSPSPSIPSDTLKRGRGVPNAAGQAAHTSKYAPAEAQRAGLTGGMTGGDSDVGTWWLDVQSPTDEEMKMLSKVN